MKKTNLFVVCIFGICLWVGCVAEKTSDNAKTLVFDSEQKVRVADFREVIDTVFQIIPLATNDDCLISKIDKLEVVDGHFYIMDCLAQSIFIFDPSGNFVGKINKRGRGPGEYPNLSYMTVTDDRIIVMDHMSRKQIIYDRRTLQFLSEDYNVFNQIWCIDVFALGNVIYYINNWGKSGSGQYRIFSKSARSDSYSKYLLFKDAPVALGINGPVYGAAEDNALAIFSGDDHIYAISGDSVGVKYKVEFKDRKAKYTAGHPERVFEDNKGQSLVLGLNRIQQSDRYIFCEVAFTENDYRFIYDKKQDCLVIYEFAKDSRFSENNAIRVNRVVNETIIDWVEAGSLKLSYKVMQDKTPRTQFEKELYGLQEYLSENDNPVLFIYNLKQS